MSTTLWDDICTTPSREWSYAALLSRAKRPYREPPFNFHQKRHRELADNLVWFELPNGLTVSCYRDGRGYDQAFLFRSDVQIDEEGEAVAVADGFTDTPLVFFNDVPLLLSFVLTVTEWPTAALLARPVA